MIERKQLAESGDLPKSREPVQAKLQKGGYAEPQPATRSEAVQFYSEGRDSPIVKKNKKAVVVD